MAFKEINVTQLVENMKVAASEVLKKDISTVRGFTERQLLAIAQQAAFVSAGIASGQITEETREYFLNNLEDMARNFVNTLRGLMKVTIEKLWNAVAKVLSDALEAATGIPILLA